MSFTPSGSETLAIEIEAEDNASGAFDDVAGSAGNLEKAVGGAGAAVGTAGVAAFAGAADAAIGFEDAMMDVQKVTSEAVAADLEDDMRDLATDVRLGHEELADLATQAGRMGAEGSDEILEFTETAAKMGASTTLASDEAGKALGKVASAVDEPLDNVDELADGINELSNNFQTDSSEIVDSAQRSGQALDTLGLQSDEILGLSAAFNEVSPTSRRAASRMQQVGESMMDPDNVEAFADVLGVTSEEFVEMREESPEETMMSVLDAVEDNDDAMQTLNDSLTTAQTRAFRDTASSADEMREAMDLSNDAMLEGGSVAEENAQDMDTFAGQMDALRSELHNVGIVMGEAFVPILLDLAEIVGPMVSTFAELNERFDGLPAVLTAATAAIGGFTVAITALTGVAATTILPIIVAIGALAGAAYALHTAWSENMGGIQDATEEMWETLQPAIQSVQDILEHVFEEYAIPLLHELQAVWEEQFAHIVEDVVETMEVIQERIETVLSHLEVFWGEHGDEIMTIVETVFAFLELTIGTIMRAISATIRVVLALIRGDFDEVLSIIADFWTTTFEEMWDFLSGEWFEGIKATFSLFYDFIVGIFEALYNYLIGNSIVPKTFNAITEFLLGWIDATMDFFTGFFNDFLDLWIERVLGIVSWLSSTGVSAFGDAFRAIGDRIIGVIRNVMSTIKDAILETVDFIVSQITGAVSDAVEIFNSTIPNRINFPSTSIGGQRVSLPSTTIGGRRIGGGSLSVPTETVGGGGLDLPQLASGGLVTDSTLAQVGEGTESEAVLPLSKLSSYLDTAYETGASMATPTPTGGSSGAGSTSTVRLQIEGDGALAELIKENAEVVVDEHESRKSDRLSRF